MNKMSRMELDVDLGCELTKRKGRITALSSNPFSTWELVFIC